MCNQIRCPVVHVGSMVILTCRVLLYNRFGLSLRLSSYTSWSTWWFVGVLLA